MEIVLNSHLGVYEWGKLFRAGHVEELTIDLTNVEFAYPSGTVALSLVVNYRSENGKPTELTLPEDPEENDVVTYLNRVDLFDSLPREVRIFQDLSSLKHHARNPSHKFTEVHVLEEEGLEDASTVVQEFLQRHVEQWRRPYEAFNEVLLNARDHSRASETNGAEGSELKFGVLHVQVYENQLELAVGDIGDGVRKSLNTCPDHDFRRSTTAIRATLERGISRFSHMPDRERGGGLRRVKNAVARMGGKLDLRSYEGSAHLANGELEYNRYQNPFPGTLARIDIPSRDRR